MVKGERSESRVTRAQRVPLRTGPETQRSQIGGCRAPQPGREGNAIVERSGVGIDLARDRLWSVEEVSYYLGVPVSTLYSWRVQRRGPACRRIGRFLRYRPEDVEAWYSALGDWPAA